MTELQLPTWNLAALYPNEETWEADFQRLGPAAELIYECRGTLAGGAACILKAVKAMEEYDRLAEKLMAFASHKADENTRDCENRARKDRLMTLLSSQAEKIAWFVPELMALPSAEMDAFIETPELAPYKRMLKELLRGKPHILSAAEETLLGQFGEVLDAPERIFGILSDADMSFGTVEDEDGQQKELTHGSYSRFLESSSRRVRKEAFEKLYTPYCQFRGTLASTLDTAVKKHVVSARVRKFPNALEASLHDDNVPREVYTSLVGAVREKLPALHKYMELRKHALKLDKLEMYDLFAPILPEFHRSYSWNEAVDLMKKGLAPLGNEYSELIELALKQQWIDAPARPGKRAGAYSGGCYDSMPYILMNYNGTLDSVFTLVHEAGHSMHSWLSNRNQPCQDARYSIFVAEVASTTNEILLSEYLLRNAESRDFKAALLSHLADEIRCTVYRQTQFAEFELAIHEAAEAGTPLTADFLDNLYYDLNRTYYGMEADKRIAHEWARVPHFYYNFYVYKYATGMSSALKLAEGILSGDENNRNAYMNFLKAGCSLAPMENLKSAGVDLSTPAPVKAALDYFENIVESLSELL